MSTKLQALNQEVIRCVACPRLVKWREQIAREKRAAFANETYWGKPMTGFGDEKARLLIVGLAPAAHGGNRTGRVFTGDRSGEWLFRALHHAEFANQTDSVSRKDGLKLKDAYISVAVRCAPPENKPLPEERDQCLPYLVREMQILKNVKVIVPLGHFALNSLFTALSHLGEHLSPKPKFKHLKEIAAGPYTIICSMHPSQQNTFTGRLTVEMFDAVFNLVRKKL